MNSFTTNYNLDLYDIDDKPNLNDQYNDAMGKIDNAMHDMAGDIVTAETAVQNLTVKVDGYDGRITQNAADITTLQTDVQTAQTTAENAVSAAHDANDLAVQASSAAQTAQTTANGAQTSANNNSAAIQAINNKFPVSATNIASNAVGTTQIANNAVTTAKIAAGAVTSEKLNASAISSIFSTLHIHHFDNRNAQADNTGMSVPSGCTMSGFYVEELKLLILNEIVFNNATVSWETFDTNAETGFKLPSYVPTPTTKMTLSGCGVMRGKDSSGAFEGWGSIGINTKRCIGPGSTISAGKQSCMYGNVIIFMTAIGASLTTLDLDNVYTGLATQNESL